MPRAARISACATAPPPAPMSSFEDDGAFAVAPMMDYTNKFLRYMLRLLSARATLYTEMVTANTIAHCA
eukprot:1683846-Prymnesium_polylepis.1